MNESSIRSVLQQAASAATLPERLGRPSAVVQEAMQRKVAARRTWVVRVGAAAAVMLVMGAGLTLTGPGRSVMAAVARTLGRVEVESGTLEEWQERFRGAKRAPAPPPMPEEVKKQTVVDVAEARRNFPFIAPVPGWTLAEERAWHPTQFGPDRQYTVNRGVTHYTQVYRTESGKRIAATQGVIVPPKEGPLYGFPPETEETKINGYAAYVRTRHSGIDGEGKRVIREFPFVTVFIPLADGVRWLEVWVSSGEASLDEVLRLAEALTDTAHTGIR